MRITAKRNFAQQASAFEPVANLYAPYWRQVNGTKLSKMSFEELEKVFGTASYHGCDYSFFYLNTRENARLRADAWFDKKKSI